jgi:hypothetical protein
MVADYAVSSIARIRTLLTFVRLCTLPVGVRVRFTQFGSSTPPPDRQWAESLKGEPVGSEWQFRWTQDGRKHVKERIKGLE